jgi:hypothetical protein
MKNRILLYTAIFSLLTFLNACMEEDEKFAKKTASDGTILITVPDVSLPAPPTGQPQLAEQNFEVVSGRFGITDNVQLKISLSEGLTTLKINTLVTSTGQRQEKGSFANVSGPVDFSYPVSTLGINNSEPKNPTGAAYPSSVVLELVATDDDNSRKVVRVFTVNVVEPFAMTNSFVFKVGGKNVTFAANPATANPDSVILLGYTASLPSVANITKVEVSVKRGVKNAETLIRTEEYNLASIADTLRFRMPSGNANPNTLDTLFFKYVATYATGKTITKTSQTRFVNVPLNTTVTLDPKQRVLTLYNPLVTGDNGDRAAYDFSAMDHVLKTGDEALKDIMLQVSGLNIGLTRGTGNGTDFVKGVTADYTNASYQVAKWSHATKPVVQSVTNVFKGDVYIVRLTDAAGIPNTTVYNEYVILRIIDINLTAAGNETDNITFEYKYYKKPL